MTFVPVDPGISEGDYTEWAKKWTKDIPDGCYYNEAVDFMINDKDDKIYLEWWNGVGWARFGIYNTSDLSEVFTSVSGTHYSWTTNDIDGGVDYTDNRIGFLYGTARGKTYANWQGKSKSIQTYLLLLRTDNKTIEVWRGGTSLLWSRDITNDEAGVTARILYISPTGKYILILASNKKLILYEGS